MEQKNNRSGVLIRRAVAFVIDWNLIFVVSFAVLISGPNFDVKYLILPSLEMFSAFNVILGILCFILLPLMKDVLFRNASLGKLITGLRVVDAETKNPPPISHLILRNVSFYLAPVNSISLFANDGKTIGDAMANTVVVRKRDLTSK